MCYSPDSVEKIVEIVVRIALQSFGEVDERGEDHDAENEEEHQQEQLLSAGLEGVHQNLQARRVSGELEETEDSNDREEVEQVAVLQAGALQQDVGVEGKGGHEIDDVDRVGYERLFVGRNEKANDDLEGEPNVTTEFNVKKQRIWFGAEFLQKPGIAGGFVSYFRYSPVGIRANRRGGERERRKE